MIPIKLSITDANLLEKEHWDYYHQKFQARLNDAVSNWPIINQQPFLQFLKQNERQLILGRPEILEDIRYRIEHQFNNIYEGLKTAKITAVSKAAIKISIPSKYVHLVHTISEMDKLKTKLSTIFNYAHFEQNINGWWAYSFVEKLGVTVCPYCNRHYTMNYISKNGNGRTRAQLDHFFSQTAYPYFSLSIYNLVPSCYVCNSNLKGDKEFTLESHYNPYENNDDFLENVKFTVKFSKHRKHGKVPDYLKAWCGNTDMFEIGLRLSGSVNRKFLKKIMKNVRVFKIRQLYNFHKDHAIEIILKKEIYNEDRISELVREFPTLFPSRESVLRIITSNYTEPQLMGKRVLSKFTRDIWEEYSSI